MRRTRWTASIMGAGLLLASCGGGGGDDSAAADQPLIVVEDASTADSGISTDSDGAGATDPAGQDGASAASGAGSEEEQALAFAQCMRDEGVDFPDPSVGADGSVSFFTADEPPAFDQNAGFNDALDVCSPLVEGASFLPSADDITELEDGLLEVAECLREQGLDVEDPDFSGGAAPGPGLFGDNFDPTDPANADALEACSDALASLNVPGVGG